MHPARRSSSRAVATIAILLGLAAAHPALAQTVPPHDKVVVVIMENKSYNQVNMLPYTASFRAAGATFTNSRAITRPSQPNYFALFAGNTFGINTNNCPIPGSPYAFPNLAQACEAAGMTWKAYSENLPAPGSTVCSADGDQVTGLYTRKHAPWTYFTNINHNNERPYTDLAADLAANALPNLTFIVPNNCNNTHNSSTPGCMLADGDAWLAANLPPILAKLGPNGALILTYDEDDGSSSNHILTAIVGPKVIPGSTYTPVANLYAVSRLISEMLGLPVLGFGVLEESIVGIWDGATPTRGTSWGEVKTIYR